MSESKHKTRLELIRDNIIVGTVEPDFGDGDNNLEISSSSSMDSFPTASIKSTDDELNKVFFDYSKLDLIRLSTCENNDNQYLTFFEGEFYSKNIKSDSDQNKFTLNIQAVHSFFRLSLFELASAQEFKGVTFAEFVLKLLQLANIKSKVHIESNLGSLPVFGLTRKVNAFRLFKEVCLIMNASVNFKSNNSVFIETRSERVQDIMAKKPVSITEKEMLSFESTERI